MKLIEVSKAEKKNQLERLLEKGIVMVFVDTRKPGVNVPPAYQGSSQLPLNLSYTFQIPDFKILEDHVEVTLHFPEGKYFCHLPFEAMYAINSQLAAETVVFPEDLPMGALPRQKNDLETAVPKIKNRSHLKLVK